MKDRLRRFTAVTLLLLLLAPGVVYPAPLVLSGDGDIPESQSGTQMAPSSETMAFLYSELDRTAGDSAAWDWILEALQSLFSILP